MSEISHLAATIFRRGASARRVIVAVAGPPAAGKSTIAAELASILPEGTAAVVPMDGFHYDDGVLDRIGLRQRKGAPETFDLGGYESLLTRLRAADTDVAVPIFDRSMELSRAAAAIVPKETKFIITEGNYLLLDEAPWDRLAPLFDFTVFLDVPRSELERRLIQRWVDYGRTPEAGRAWVDSNDLPNVDRVLTKRRPADTVIAMKAAGKTDPH
jgi:pantothenate kinase